MKKRRIKRRRRKPKNLELTQDVMFILDEIGMRD